MIWAKKRKRKSKRMGKFIIEKLRKKANYRMKVYKEMKIIIMNKIRRKRKRRNKNGMEERINEG